MPPKAKASKQDKSSKDEKSKSSDDPKKLKPANSVKVRHILCEKQSKGCILLLCHSDCRSPGSSGQTEGGTFTYFFRLTTSQGQRFDKVAQEYSEDKAKVGGDLGWLSRNSPLAGPFKEAAVDTPTNYN